MIANIRCYSGLVATKRSCPDFFCYHIFLSVSCLSLVFPGCSLDLGKNGLFPASPILEEIIRIYAACLMVLSDAVTSKMITELGGSMPMCLPFPFNIVSVTSCNSETPLLWFTKGPLIKVIWVDMFARYVWSLLIIVPFTIWISEFWWDCKPWNVTSAVGRGWKLKVELEKQVLW